VVDPWPGVSAVSVGMLLAHLSGRRTRKVGGRGEVVDDGEAGEILYLIMASGKSVRNRSVGFRERLGDGERHHFLLCQIIHCFLTTWV
jgi:hypothetical protein